MKHLFTLCLCLASVLTMNAQSVSLFNVDASGFPTVKAKFYAFDASGNQVRPSASEFSISENGIPRVITNLTCPPPAPPVAISSVLTVDVSGSMNGGSNGTANIELAKAAAKAWIQGLPAGQSECALSSFDDHNYLHQDFTTDRSRLLGALSTLNPNGGTNYDMGLLQPLAGSLQISKRGKYKRVVVFLSDGLPNSEPNSAAIIAEAKRQNCMVFAVTLGMPCPQSLKNISSQTGGQFYENVTTIQEAENVYRKIMQVGLSNEPCEITWSSSVTCEAGNTSVQMQWQSQTLTESYTIPFNAIASLIVTPSFVTFGKRLPSTQNDTIITLSVQNADFTITGINRKFGSTEFTVVNPIFPLYIPKNTSKSITLRFAPRDSGMQHASFEIVTDKCPGSISAYGGFPGKKTTTSTLKLTHPNGGEHLVVGSDTVITWTGIAPSDTVWLEYSINRGATWQRITNQASGLKYVWKNVPSPPSDQCLVRVHQRGNIIVSRDSLLTLTAHTNPISGVAFSPDGSSIATVSSGTNFKIWDSNTGTLLRTISDDPVCYKITYSPDGSKIATASFGNTAKIWDANSGALLRTLTGHLDQVLDVAFSPDGNKIATGSWDRFTKIWDVNSGNIIKTITGHNEGVWGVAFSPDGSRITTGSEDKTAKIWDANTGALIQTIQVLTNGVRGVSYSPEGSRIATALGDSTAKIWDANTGALIQDFIGHNGSVSEVDFSPDGSKIATASGDSTAKIWDANTGVLIRTLKGHSAYVSGVAYSPDGTRIATSSYDNTAKIWDVDLASIQEDSSDAVFSIIAPSPASQNVDMKQCLVRSVRDSVVVSFAQNIGTYPFRVDSIAITGANASEFSLVSGIPPFTVQAGRAKAVEFRFSPASSGMKTAQIEIYTQAEILRQTIIGEGIPPALSIVNNIIDFGEVLLGSKKDTIKAVTIKNNRAVPLTITSTHHAGPNDVDFVTLTGGGNFVLAPFDTARLDLEFQPKSEGRTSGRLLFDYNEVGSPATVQLFGDGIPVRTTIIAQDITAQAGEKVNLSLKLLKSTGMQITGAPTDWYARIHYNKSILFNEQTSNVCQGTTDSCVLELTGVYNPKSDELISIPCSTTLGNIDHSTIVIDTFYWTNSAIATEVATQNGSITLNGICDDGGVRLFIPAKNSTSLASRPNPAQDNLQIQYGLREPLTVTLELLTMTGQVVQTIVNNQAQAMGQYTLTSDLSVLGNGVYLLRLRTNKEMLTARVDVVK
jgi:WD40 repeat protein